MFGRFKKAIILTSETWFSRPWQFFFKGQFKMLMITYMPRGRKMYSKLTRKVRISMGTNSTISLEGSTAPPLTAGLSLGGFSTFQMSLLFCISVLSWLADRFISTTLLIWKDKWGRNKYGHHSYQEEDSAFANSIAKNSHWLSHIVVVKAFKTNMISRNNNLITYIQHYGLHPREDIRLALIAFP